jgi:putative effector of murein hydrolase
MASSILLAVISSSVFSQAPAWASSSAHPAAEAGAAAIGARARTVSTARIMDLSPAEGMASAGLRMGLCNSS